MENEIIKLDSTIKVDMIAFSEDKGLGLKTLSIYCPESSIMPIIEAATKRGIPHERFNEGIMLFAE
jgi:hypothetical protein